MPNGLDIEKALFEGLEAVGFRLAPYHEGADQEHKVDRVILGPPPIDSPFWLEPAVAVQVTKKPSQWQKMWTFKEAAARVAPRLVYIELNDVPIEEIIQVVIASLYYLYYADDAPHHAWIKTGLDKFRVADLNAALSPYDSWLTAALPDGIRGRINYWRKSDQYGFAQGSVRGPSDEPEMPFFLHASQITDPQLRTILDQFDGDIPMEQQPSIIFDDAGPATDYPRKAAKNIRSATPITAPAQSAATS